MPHRRPPNLPVSEGGQRLQKVLAAAGLGSRRQCEELIVTGRIEVDRQVVTELGTRVDPAIQEIRADGVALSRPKHLYFAVNKPTGVVSTNRDPAGRPRVIDLVAAHGQRLFPIGRLDLNSEGLILVTNDGELANRLTHPRYEVAKTYRVLVAGQPEQQMLDRLVQGIHLAEGFVRAERVLIKSHHKHSTILEIVLREGRNREVRRMFARLGHKVLRLVRIAVGPIRLGTLPPGETRRLTSQEIDALRRAMETRTSGQGRGGHRSARPSAKPSGARKGGKPVAANKPGEKRRPGPGTRGGRTAQKGMTRGRRNAGGTAK